MIEPGQPSAEYIYELWWQAVFSEGKDKECHHQAEQLHSSASEGNHHADRRVRTP
jgi:hypothetical protein